MQMARLSAVILTGVVVFSSAYPTTADGPLNCVSVQTRKPLSQLIEKDEIRKSIALWVESQQSFLETYFQKNVSIRVDEQAADFLASEYADRQISPELFENRELSRFVVRMDLLTVLKRSFEETIKAKYKTLFHFIQSQRPAVTISLPDIKSAIQEEDCSIIPCPPDKCNPDCSPKSFERFSESPGLYPCTGRSH